MNQSSELDDMQNSPLRAQQRSGLALWRAECADEVAPPAELRDLRRRYGWTSRQITVAFEALAEVVPRRLGSGYLVFDRDLTSREASTLASEKLIQLHRDGWTLTRKGEELFDLLLAYGDPRHRWASPRREVGR